MGSGLEADDNEGGMLMARWQSNSYTSVETFKHLGIIIQISMFTVLKLRVEAVPYRFLRGQLPKFNTHKTSYFDAVTGLSARIRIRY